MAHELTEEQKKTVRKLALKNAIDYGKSNESSVISKVVSAHPELKKDFKSLAASVKAIVEEVNGLSKEELEREYKEYEEEFAEAYKEKVEATSKPRMELEGAETGSFKTRFPPAPTGYLHIGHTKAAFLEDEFRRIYKGKLVLFFDDTNPEDERQEFVDAIKKDFEWLGIRFDDEYYASDNIGKMYEYAAVMIQNANAYVCSCDSEKMKIGRERGTGCEHKLQPPAKNRSLWESMLESAADSRLTLRLNWNMKAQNTAMRDPVLFRIKKEKHYRQGNKYWIWPTYNFNTPIMDSINGITDTLRDKNYELRDELYNTILDLLKLRKPRLHSFARLEIKDNVTSKRELNKMIKEGLIQGYDDPRLVTIAALRRRGVLPSAIRDFVLRSGMSKTNSEVAISMLLDINRKMADSIAKRLFFVEHPVKLEISDIPNEKWRTELRLHPSLDLGTRSYLVDRSVYIDRDDAKELHMGSVVRLKGAFCVEVKGMASTGVTGTYTEDAEKAKPIHWVPSDSAVRGKLLMIGNLMQNEQFNRESITTREGFVESHARNLSEGDIVQFERIGLFKFDSKSDMSFISL